MSTSTISITSVQLRTGALRSVMMQLGAAALLGMGVFYGVAFAESPTLHNAAHDVRHVTVKPCH